MRAPMIFTRFRKKSALSQPADPQMLFSAATKDRDYSDKACLRSWATKTTFLTGLKAGQQVERGSKSRKTKATEKLSNMLEKASKKLKFLESLKHSKRTVEQQLPASYCSEGAIATLAITRVEPGVYGGQKAHFIQLHCECLRDEAHYFDRILLDVRFWRAGDALQSIAAVSHLPLSSFEEPLALHLADNAPSVVLYTPRAVVGRPADATTEPYWAGRFKPDATFRYAASAHAPQENSRQKAKDKDPLSLLHIVAYGDWLSRIPVPPSFNFGLVVLSDGRPFDMTVHSVSYHATLYPALHYLRTPYCPARFNGTARLVAKGEEPLAVDFASVEMRTKMREIFKWAEPFDTIWIGDKQGCAGQAASHGRRCGSKDCGLCDPVSREKRRKPVDWEAMKRRAEKAASEMYPDVVESGSSSLPSP